MVRAAIVESVVHELHARVREAYSALREADIQCGKSEERSVKAQRIAESDREAAKQRRLELGMVLLDARKQWPERGPKAKGWGEFLESEGLAQSTAHHYMQIANGKISPSLSEIPHPATTATNASLDHGKPVDPPRKPFGKLLDMDLFVGTWQDMLGDIGKVNTIITDPPYSARVHESKATRNDDSDAEGLAPNYEPWDAKDVEEFVEHWSPRCRGWMLCLCDDELIPAYRTAYERMGRVSFAPVPCVITGMSVRTRGDGPSSWAVYAMVARPSGGEYVKWGTLPGAYVGTKVSGSKHGRGKPPWLTDEFVRHYTRENDLVCDPLAGYGGTLVSALQMRRRAIGAEQDPVAVEEAFRRVNENQFQRNNPTQTSMEAS